MLIHLKDSTFRLDKVTAITKGVLPETNYTPLYYTMCVYVEGSAQPIVHTYETEEERNENYTLVRGHLVDADNR